MGATTGCILLLAALAAHAASNKIKEQVEIVLPTGAHCYRLLNATGQFGCGSSMRGNEGVIVVARTKADVMAAENGWKERFPSYSGGFMVVMDELLLDGETASLLRSSNRVAGVLLQPVKDGEAVSEDVPLSSEPACPNQHSSLYSDWRACGSSEEKQWNGKGAMLEQGMRFVDWPFPIARVSNETVLAMLIKCHDAFNLPEGNARKDGKLCAVGNVKTFMTASGSSTECVRRQTPHWYDEHAPITKTLCEPLNDYSLHAILPSGGKSEKGGEYLAVITKMDSISLLSDATPATYSTMTSIVAALAAAKVIGNNLEAFEEASKRSDKRIIFAFLHGESFDYTGSSRWVYDMENGGFPMRKSGKSSEEVPELISLDNITLAVELQQLDGSGVLHAHVDGENYEADEMGKIKNALEMMKKNMTKRDGIELKENRVNGNGVLPPSSLHSILKRSRQIPSVLVTSFDEQYSNRRFHSAFDRLTGGKEEEERVKKSLAAVARGVVALMADHVGIDEETKKTMEIDQEWLDKLSSCFIATTKIPDCPYFKGLFEAAEPVDRRSPITEYRSLVKIVHKLLILATGEHKSTSVVESEDACKEVDEKQAMHKYEWQVDPERNASFCYRTSIWKHLTLSPAFVPDENGESHVAGSAYSTWAMSMSQTSSSYSMFLVESDPADWTVLFFGLLTVLLSILIVGRCDDSSFIVDEGERAAEEGEPL